MERGKRDESVAILGIIGGSIGFLMGLAAFVAGGIGTLLSITGAFAFFKSSWIAIFLSTVGMVGALASRYFAIPGGVAMLVSGTVGIYTVRGFFIIPSVLLVISGIITLVASSGKWSVRKLDP